MSSQADRLGISAAFMTQILEQLSDARYWVRLLAVRRMVEEGGASPEVVNILFDVLEKAEEDLRTAAVEGLSELLPANPAILPLLLERLEHPDPEVRWRIVWVLGRLRTPSSEIVMAVLACLRDPDVKVRERAATALGKLGVGSSEVISALVTALDDLGENGYENDDVRENAAEALGKLDNATASEVAAALLSCFSEFHCRGGNQGHKVMDAVHRLVQRSPELLATLRAWARDEEHPHQHYAHHVVIDYPEPSGIPGELADDEQERGEEDENLPGPAVSTDEIDALLAQLRQDLSPDVVRRIAQAQPTGDTPGRGQQGRELYPVAVDHLIDLVRRNPSIQTYLLARLTREPNIVQATVVVALVRAPTKVERLQAVRVGQPVVIDQHPLHHNLGGQEWRTLLLTLLHDPEPVVRHLAIAGICTLDGAIPLEYGTTNLPPTYTKQYYLDWWHSPMSIGAMASWMEACAETTVVALLEALRERSSLQSEAASRELVLHTPISLECTDILLTYLRSPQPKLDNLATSAFSGSRAIKPGFLGVADPRVIDALLDAREHPNRQQRHTTLQLLTVVATSNPSVLGALHDWLQDPEESVRRAALRTLAIESATHRHCSRRCGSASRMRISI